MRVLLIGSGGREHALAWKLRQSSRVDALFVAPGSDAIDAEPDVRSVPIPADDLEALLAFADAEAIDLTVVGPEAPLVAGIADRFAAAGLRLLGPSRAAAALEGSKAFAKAFMQRHGIPTARYAAFTDSATALAYIRDKGAPLVIKADGLAAGKGVIVARDLDTAESAVRDMLDDGRFGESGARIVVEEFLQGEEASFIVLCDGRRAVPLASSQDHKARDDGDRGPNTGGMGACSPAAVVDTAVAERVMRDIVTPTVDGLIADGTPYVGFLYVGLMIDSSGTPRVVEYNVRLGDPETQVLLPRLDSDLVDLCLAAASGDLTGMTPQWSSQAAIGIVLAAGDYPAGSSRGERIDGLDAPVQDGARVFHAGTRRRGPDTWETAGGRVLCVTALGDTVGAARDHAADVVQGISWPRMHHRRDIGWRAIEREVADATEHPVA